MHPLIQASKFIEQHMEVFDTRQSQCECCGMIKYENFREAQSHKELGALAKKLRDRYSLSNSNSI